MTTPRSCGSTKTSPLLTVVKSSATAAETTKAVMVPLVLWRREARKTVTASSATTTIQDNPAIIEITIVIFIYAPLELVVFFPLSRDLPLLI